MRAAQFDRYGPAEVLRIVQVPLPPPPGPTDVLVEVHATSVNPVDCKIRAGHQRGAVRLALPWTLGFDVSGVVASVGSEVTQFTVGDEVYGSPPHQRPGAYAESLLADEGVLARKPARLTHAEAASVPLVGLTALQSLDAGAVVAGHRLLVLAGAGGVGTLAIQLAKARGAHVTTTASARNEALVRKLGADVVLDHHLVDPWDHVADLDFVLCTLGGGQRFRALGAVKRGGTVVSVVMDLPRFQQRYGMSGGLAVTAAGLGAFWARGALSGRRARSLVRRCDGRDLERLTPLLEAGTLRPVLDRVLPLEAIAQAHRASEAGHCVGKVVLTVR